MENLIKQFEKESGISATIESELYADGEIYAKEYTEWLEKRIQALSMSGVSGSVPYVDREKELEESLSVLLEMASTWGREWFKSETWEKVEKARQVLAGTDR